VEAGTEVVKIFSAKQRGGGSNAEKLLRELVLKPGELMVDDPEAVINRDGTFGQGRNFTRSHAR